MSDFTIARVTTDDEILATWPVMKQLRPHIADDAYVPTVRRMMTNEGYGLVALRDADGVVRALGGYRFIEMLYCGKSLYVDDLVSDETARSHGYGKAVLAWLESEARAHGCVEFRLDSGVQRKRAHAFYFRERMTIAAYHFSKALG